MLKLKGLIVNQLLLYIDLVIFYVLTWPDFWKCFKTTEKGLFKKEKIKNEHFDLARTRKCAECCSDEPHPTPRCGHLIYSKFKNLIYSNSENPGIIYKNSQIQKIAVLSQQIMASVIIYHNGQWLCFCNLMEDSLSFNT